MKPCLNGTLVIASVACVVGVLAACSAEPPATSSPSSGGQGGAGPLGGSGGAGGAVAGLGGAGAGGTAGGAGSSAGVGGVAGSAVGGVGGALAGAGAGGALGGAGAGASAGTAGQGATSGVGSGGIAGSASGAAGTAGTGGGAPGECVFTVESQTADKAGQGGIPTVGIVNWSVDLPNVTSASIAFTLMGASTSLTAPVDITQAPNYRTLLLGMKGSKTYNFQITASNGTTSCTSMSYPITTGAVPSAVPRITRTTGPAAASQKKGFIVTSTGFAGGGGRAAYAFIIDADGEPVWWAPGPVDCTRAKMSHDGQHMWMVTLNVTNGQNNGGGVDRVSMDGLTRNTKISGLSNCHHDITVTPTNKVACASWVMQSGDQPSNLIEGDAEGNVTTVVRLDAMVYPGGQSALGGGNAAFHANAIHYHPSDDTYTISDRNPSMVVKVNRQGQALWQVGGSCTNAPADGCVGASWKVNHGHDLLEDGSLLIFNNGQSGASAALNYSLNTTGTFAATQDWSYNPGTTSNVLGDVQWLPGGNALITFSTAGIIHEIDSSRAIVQTINAGVVGYADWRETLYGPPARY